LGEKANSNTTTFAGTGWWSLPDPTGLGNTANSEALKTAAANFANASMAGLPELSPPPPVIPPPIVTPPSTVTPPPSDTTAYLNLSSGNYSTSWNMVSFPNMGSPIAYSTVFSSVLNNFKLRSYNGGSNSYTKDGISLTPGQGYWMKVDDTNNINGIKYPLNQTTSTKISTTKGWNLLGNPYQSDLPISNLQVKYKDGTTRSFADAVTRKDVAGYAWSWDAASKQYNFISTNPDKYKTTAPKGTVVKPYKGFWMIVKSDQVSGVILNK
jgi:hypothetical protein